MPSRTFRFALFCLALLGMGAISRAGISADTPYTERGKTDFDTALQLLNPYGSWSKIDGKWAFTPRDGLAPYTDGRWIYTEYGWYWKGALPHGWVTEHYGYWKRGANKVWSWYPGPYWLPQIVEIRATSGYIGWRSGEVDEDGNFVEAPIDRYSKTDEWTFVTREQFANPITPKIVAPPNVTETELEESTDCAHTYLTYREIDRPGPHPADFADLCKDGGMFAPKTLRDELATQSAPPNPEVPTAGVTPTALPGAQVDPAVDTRQVKYWITMSLPTFWSKPPADAKPEQIYLYRPDFYQDQDGIERRITLWFNPNARTNLKDILGENMPDAKPTAGSATPAMPAVPASSETAPLDNPFRSPFGDSAPPAGTNTSTPAHESTKNFAPSGLRAPDASGTNAAPAGG
ncbi:MAG TPA: DUF6600 domain-containing protein [Candidatus Methylacidiphilales bacterium]|jgi:hypothetical protein|nr:DUF6600 domain-containing protein [Candidatus Methylacidiphilales bacterium]